jgi:osmoprotectant transport system ATP-binding protein
MILFENVSKVYDGGVSAVKDLCLQIKKNEVLVLLGTSGSGKTTCIKMVNRLEEVTSGRILVDGIDVKQYDPVTLRRKMGYAVQHIGLFPHMTVAKNIAIVPRLLHWEQDRIDHRVRELLDMVGLFPDEFSERYPHQLSGGQQQRVGVARALAADPAILLMDEPFGAIDPITRYVLQDAFLNLQKSLRKTVVFVTHDIFEAVKLGDRIALLDDGKLQQLDTPAQLIQNPANRFVQQFLGTQRFQLMLLTRTLGEIIDINTLRKSDERLSEGSPATVCLTDSIIDVLDTCKKDESAFLGIQDDKGVVGRLEMNDIMAALSHFLKKWVNT